MTKQKKLITIIVSCVLVVALLTTAIILIVANSNREKTETSIMTCDVNPKVHFVLNGNDKVMKVIALNADGEVISNNGDFVGLKAEVAAELFIKLSTESGYIDVNTEGTRVDVTITGLKNNYNNLVNKVVASINGYFDNNVICTGEVCVIPEDVPIGQQVRISCRAGNRVDRRRMVVLPSEIFKAINGEANLRKEWRIVREEKIGEEYIDAAIEGIEVIYMDGTSEVLSQNQIVYSKHKKQVEFVAQSFSISVLFLIQSIPLWTARKKQ